MEPCSLSVWKSNAALGSIVGHFPQPGRRWLYPPAGLSVPGHHFGMVGPGRDPPSSACGGQRDTSPLTPQCRQPQGAIASRAARARAGVLKKTLRAAGRPCHFPAAHPLPRAEGRPHVLVMHFQVLLPLSAMSGQSSRKEWTRMRENMLHPENSITLSGTQALLGLAEATCWRQTAPAPAPSVRAELLRTSAPWAI